VTGVVITVIGISLLPVAMRWAAGGVPGTPTFGAPTNIAVAAITMAIIVLIYRFLLKVAREAADPFTAHELEAALAHHPRIGQRATGGSAAAALSRSEQAGLERGADLEQRLATRNEAYEKRFGRVFLIRAAGRTTEEVRLDNDSESEDRVVAGQLREIAVLRLSGRVAE
jgi:2-oxo-4-hydroxy-4-carboxy-5-ureidoimidazoline decarboxylase